MIKIEVSAEELRRLYLDEKLTVGQTASILGCNKWIVQRRLRAMGIPPQPYHHTTETKAKIGDKARLRYLTYPENWSKINLPEGKLRALYLDEKMGSSKLARIFNCDAQTVIRRLEEIGIPRRKQTEYHGEFGPAWRGGRRKRADGYIGILTPNHPKADSGGYVPEHILVCEKTLGKPLPEGWIVHHLNGIRDDNRPENLVPMPKGAHNKQFDLYQKRIRELEINIMEMHSALTQNEQAND